MDRQEFDRYLQERYRDQIQWYEAKSASNKRMYLWFQWAVIILSSALPVLIASLPATYEWATVGIAIVLAVGTAGLKTFKFQEQWISYRTVAETLKKEEYAYRAQLGGYKECDDRDALFVERVEALISRENTMWVVTHMQKDEKKPKS